MPPGLLGMADGELGVDGVATEEEVVVTKRRRRKQLVAFAEQRLPLARIVDQLAAMPKMAGPM